MANIRASQAVVLAAGAYPADGIRVPQALALAAIDAEDSMAINVSQVVILLAARGRVNDPKIRAWTFTLDGHDYYVLRLGNRETLVYDTHSQAWYVWGSDEGDLWRAYNGCNWLGGTTQGGGYGSNIVVGDDGNGSLYFLDPDSEVDDDSLLGEAVPRTFQRVVQGQVVTKGYQSERCYGVQLTGSIADVDDPTYTDVTLSISDDQGETYTDCGTITVEQDAPNARLHWRSLGSIRNPGRLFKIVDYGALTRIDSLDMDNGAD
jgi:hypothetical protein